MSEINTPNSTGLSEEDFNKRISNTIDPNNLPQVTDELEMLLEFLQKLHNGRVFNSAEMARLSTKFAEARGAIEEAKKTLIVNVGGQKGEELTKLGLEAQKKEVQRAYLSSKSTEIQNSQETASNTAKNLGEQGAQQVISMLQKIINIINELATIANKQ